MKLDVYAPDTDDGGAYQGTRIYENGGSFGSSGSFLRRFDLGGVTVELENKLMTYSNYTPGVSETELHAADLIVNTALSCQESTVSHDHGNCTIVVPRGEETGFLVHFVGWEEPTWWYKLPAAQWASFNDMNLEPAIERAWLQRCAADGSLNSGRC